MKRLYIYLCIFLFLFAGCKAQSSLNSDLIQDNNIQAYFNHRDTGKKSYREPYREVKRTGDNLEAIVIEEIEKATSSIDLAIQELQLPNIALALAERAKKGIKIRVILDNNYSRPISDRTLAEIDKLPSRERNRSLQYFQLVDIDNSGVISSTEANKRDTLVIIKNAGIPLIDDTADGSKGSGLMHHKFLVIDNQKVITGSTNFTLSGVYGDLNNLETKGNVNHLVVISNPELANIFTEEFNYLWGERGDNKFGLDKPFRLSRSISWQDTKITVQFSPASRKQLWQDSGNGLIGDILESAKNKIDLALFVFSDQKLADILQAEQKQGVKIRTLIDRGFIFRYYSEALDMLGTKMLNKCQYEQNNNPWQKPIKDVGVANLVKGDKLHHKIAIIDEDTVITGSQNWSAAANYSNDETVLIIQNKTVAKHFQQEFERLYRDARLGLTELVTSKITKQRNRCN